MIIPIRVIADISAMIEIEYTKKFDQKRFKMRLRMRILVQLSTSNLYQSTWVSFLFL